MEHRRWTPTRRRSSPPARWPWARRSSSVSPRTRRPTPRSPAYPCCSFRGAVVAVNAKTGKMLWKTYTVPSNTGTERRQQHAVRVVRTRPAGCGYTGGGVWGTPTIDTQTQPGVRGDGQQLHRTRCRGGLRQRRAELPTPPTSDAGCTAPDDYFDSVLALNLQTGAIEWGHKVEGWDAWNVACAVGDAPGATWCPSPASPDFDFGGSSPNLFDRSRAQRPARRSSVTGRRAASTGRSMRPTGRSSGTRWSARAPRSAASSGERLRRPEHLHRRVRCVRDPVHASTASQSVAGGSWSALDPQTGAIKWQTATPDGGARPRRR